MDDTNKIVRTICLFTDKPSHQEPSKIEDILKKLNGCGFTIQTKRICSPVTITTLDNAIADSSIYCSVGTLSKTESNKQLDDFYKAKNVAFNIELSKEKITESEADILFNIIQNKPEKTFSFAYVFNNAHSSPYFPSVSYNQNGFTIGLQPTDLSENCRSLDEWLNRMQAVWAEIIELFKDDKQFLGIDSSIAPLFEGKSSVINFIKRLGLDFSQSVTTDIYMRITRFIKEQNPQPIGLCGLMFPCLEDFELAEEYAKDNFSLERNIFLSLHSGLGIDTYPIGINENHKRVVDILSLIQALSNKYGKPLSVRFVSDGKAKIGEKTDFNNQYLKDIVVKKI
jgi:uncharacterized protein (UPF0210 family)